MNKFVLVFLLNFFSVFTLFAQPISLHPENPHYLYYKGNPTVLITSAEHYGAVLNADFDFRKYLQTMHSEGMNYTRIFTGSYIEIPGSFGIENNTLAPKLGSFLAPWKRVAEAGLYKGEKKFDLSKWNPEYFERLDKFIALANELDIIVEVTFFSSTYQDASWKRHPFNPENNINGLPQNLDRKKSNTLENGILTNFQKELVGKLVTELNSYDNIFYEIQNEPWSDDPQKVMRTLRTLNPNPGKENWFKWAEKASDASLEWQKQMAQVIVETEKQLPQKHIIAQNYTNFKCSLEKIDPNISILNFHYVW
ncbi:MAG: glycoside hydrolase family 5 protein, partial [Draconibacterium sp.]|nr:glycoside hydrolase family 5 protein [Draconibacterium sp.]